MSDSNFQPRSEFVRAEANPQSYSLVAFNGTDTLRCHGLSSAALSALREVFGDEVRLYGENSESEIAEFVFRNSPWSNKTIRSETLITNLFAVLLVQQYTFLTTIDYGRQYLDKLSLTFARPTTLSNVAQATESIFALSFTAPTILRIVAAPLHATPAILQSVRGAWPRGVKSERKLGNGSWEFRLKGFGYFSTEKSDEAVLPHVFTLLRALDVHAFRLLAAIPIGGRSRAKDLWLFTAPGASRPGRNSPGGSGSVQSPGTTVSPYQPTIESSEPYSPGPFITSPGAHGRFATDEPQSAVPLASGHARSPSAGVGAGQRKPAPAFVPSLNGSPVGGSIAGPGPMAMPVPVIAQPVPPVPVSQSPVVHSSPVPVPVPIPAKRNSSLLRKFRAGGGGGSGRTPSGGFKHPPPPPGFKPGSEDGRRNSTGAGSQNESIGRSSGSIGRSSGSRKAARTSLSKGRHGRQRSLASGEIIYETPTPQPTPSPNPQVGEAAPVPPLSPSGFVVPPPPPTLQSPTSPSPQSPLPQLPIVTSPNIQAVPAIMTTSPTTTAASLPLTARPDMLTTNANRTTEELLLPRGAFRDSAFSTSTDLSHDVAVIWTGDHLGGARPGDHLGGVKEEMDEVEVRLPDVMPESEKRPKSEKVELAIVEPGPPPPLPGMKHAEVGKSGEIGAGAEKNEEPDAGKSEEPDKDKEKHVKQPSKSATPNEWVFVSVDKGKGGSDSSASPPEETPPAPAEVESPSPPPNARKGSFKRWFGASGASPSKPKQKAKPKPKPTRRRGGMVQAFRSSKRLTIE